MPLTALFLFQLTALSYALIGGVFLAFSDFIMRALARTSGYGGAEAMQHINIEVFRWVFMTLFLGLVPASLALAIYSATMLSGISATLGILASALYLIGCFGVTAACNVPLNEKLKAMDSTSRETLSFWDKSYVPNWTFWNSVRTTACLFAALMLLTAVALSVS